MKSYGLMRCETIRGFYENWRDAYEEFEQVVEEIRDLAA
jgi:hypothetical protein